MVENKLTDVVFRDEKVAFMGLTHDAEEFHRMRGFTELNPTKDAETEERKYVDERSKRTKVTSISSSLEFGFDEYKDNDVLTDIVDIIELEKMGTDATRPIVIVDFTREEGEGFRALKRDYVVQPDTSGADEYLYTHEGEFLSDGELIQGIAVVDEDGMTCTFEPKIEEGTTDNLL